MFPARTVGRGGLQIAKPESGLPDVQRIANLRLFLEGQIKELVRHLQETIINVSNGLQDPGSGTARFSKEISLICRSTDSQD